MITLDQVEELGGYTVIYADPPWQYNDKGSNGAAEKHYSTMSIEEVCAMPVKRLAAPTSALFLWAVGPMLPDAFRVIDAWGFTYKTVAFNWIKSKNAKDFFGLGRWTRQNAEYCLLGIRDRPERRSASVRQVVFAEEDTHRFTVDWDETQGTQPDDVCRVCGTTKRFHSFWFPGYQGETLGAQIQRHSAKPPEARERIVELLGDVPRIELFARTPTEGWDVWGDEVECSVDMGI